MSKKLKVPLPKQKELQVSIIDKQSTEYQSEVTEEKIIRDTWDNLKKYKDGRAELDNRLIENENYWLSLQWDLFRSKNPNREGEPEPTSNYLFSTIISKHADLMDNIPSQNILPQEEGDREEAETLADIIPVVLEGADYEDTYSKTTLELLKQGWAPIGVLFNKEMNGIGDIEPVFIDNMSFIWQPGVSDIQASENIFILTLQSKASLKRQYPNKELETSKEYKTLENYPSLDNFDTDTMCLVVDRYYHNEHGNLQFCKVVNQELLASTELDAIKIGVDPEPFYEDNEYPFEIVSLWPEKNSPAGFGLVDVLRKIQMYVDKMDQGISKNMLMNTLVRYFMREDVAVNKEDIQDWSNPFVFIKGQLDLNQILQEIKAPKLDSWIINFRDKKIEEMKEIPGANDFTRGEAGGGVTAAAAIRALQEAGNKISRSIIKNVYNMHRKVIYKVIERIRQFYDEPRKFRITGKNSTDYTFKEYTNKNLKEQVRTVVDSTGTEQELIHKPYFDIKVVAERKDPFSQMATNELAIALYKAGMFDPNQAESALVALEMMDFEDRDMIMEKVKENSTMLQQVQMLIQQVQQLQQQTIQPVQPPVNGVVQ